MLPHPATSSPRSESFTTAFADAPRAIECTLSVADVLAKMVREAGTRETCAVLSGRWRLADVPAWYRIIQVTEVLPMHNLAPDPHRNFACDPLEFARIEARVRTATRRFLGFFHTHPTGSTHASRQDVHDAWPGTLQVIGALARSPQLAMAEDTANTNRSAIVHDGTQLHAHWCAAKGRLQHVELRQIP